MTDTTTESKELVKSYLRLRQIVGVLGLTLPFVLIFGWMVLSIWVGKGYPGIESSISAYYHTGMRNFFVGYLCAIGVVLLSYRPYKNRDGSTSAPCWYCRLVDRLPLKLDDDGWGNLAGVCALGVAFFPTRAESALVTLVSALHLVFAVIFFLTIAYFSLCLFTKSDKEPADRTPRKRTRNKVFVICGYGILLCVAAIVLDFIFERFGINIWPVSNPVFWLESVAVILFGTAWLTKGEAILGDTASA